MGDESSRGVQLKPVILRLIIILIVKGYRLMFLLITEWICYFRFLFNFDVQKKKTRPTLNDSKHKPKMNRS